ncbi:MAG: NTP transferase domain-containing protein [Candidatus Marinimicrobia bacterium]|nr:NTP transferase domain-containing protein [Candidatus Neomarinimicrobiota bacterium]
MIHADNKLAAIILAAGRGKRMNSDLPKVLHEVGGRPMVTWVADTAREVGAQPIIVIVGTGQQLIEATLSELGATFVPQGEPLGTAHAVLQARSFLENFEGDVVVLSGDVPGITAHTVRKLLRRHTETGASATMMSGEITDPTGYGRVIKDGDGHLLRVVEERDTSPDEKLVTEVNAGVYLFRAADLFRTLPLVKNNNQQKEYYLPQVLSILLEQNKVVTVEKAENYREILGVNTQTELRRVHAETFS